MIGSTSLPFRLLVGLLYLFLLAPILVVVPLSFSNDNYLTFPPQSWGVRWYAEMLQHETLIQAFWISLGIASVVTVLSLLAGIPAAYAIRRYQFRGREAVLNLFTAPLLLPSIVLGLAILLVFVRLELLGTFTGLVIAHLIVTTPYVIRIMITAFSTLPPSVEEAATMLGASPFTVFRRITLPLMMPGLVASAALSFLLSFDEVVISLFITGPRMTTLPVEIFNYVESRTDPMTASISVVLIAATLLIIFVIERTLGLSRTIGK
ncbi:MULTISPECIES: ABC transporter permease [Brucella/Ochrobactrum group]|jgi:putative spermidine/putrescine transport system permease protein|uniref:ABC transporter permease n=1 Tax=Brucella pseudintermedia TaxID=370111 RepID=A0ABY5UJI2_9HYPH|nr:MULTISPECIES: ABC transporter permease [Brucella/Ochrobactrum group]KAB2684826.1 ABC transporter permease [Brucella pseudintermedia]MCO7728437.1 ABC transporter permease [Brucella intermedia]NKE74506.1 ABC transporter permease [Ochrobactrum sp. MC-1LL]TWH02789.1 putative spermidine/putrescine transport system permease protein [Ochrobactrum sp. J50]UWL61920.1 ABC transporter permease [Brucella pseudintermedia]